jgi:hypothetical protein
MKNYHYSRFKHLQNCLVSDHWSFQVKIHVVQIKLLISTTCGNKGTHKLCISTMQVESNVQSLIDLSMDIMPHQMKWIRNGR